MKDIEVAIVGAGPHGISAAVHLRRAGINAHVFGEPMSFWRTMPRGMKLRSNMSATSMVEPVGPLSLTAYSEDAGVQLSYPVPLSRFVDYGLWVRRAAGLEVDPRLVNRVERRADGFALELDDGDCVSARRVVVASGIAPFARIPPGFSHFPASLVSHTSRHRDLAAFAGRRVAMVGSGQSAFECAALMAEHGAEVEVLARSSEVVWLRRQSPKNFMGPAGGVIYAPTDVGPAWYSRLVSMPDLFRRLPRQAQTRIAYRAIRPACSHFVRERLDGVGLTLGVSIDLAEGSNSGMQLGLSDGTERQVDHLMFGTGYKVDVAKYPFLGPEILDTLRRVDGYPVLRRGLETSVPGLHMVGAPASWSFGPILRFVSGSWYSGRAVSASIASASPRRRAVPQLAGV